MNNFPSQMLTETNKLRSSPLGVHASLQAAAQKHAQWMANNRRMSHTGEHRSSFIDRIRAENYPSASAAENVAAGQRDGAECVDAWRSSLGHRRNMLNTAYRSCGFGAAQDSAGKWYFCGLYGEAAPTVVAPPPIVPEPKPLTWWQRVREWLGL